MIIHVTLLGAFLFGFFGCIVGLLAVIGAVALIDEARK